MVFRRFDLVAVNLFHRSTCRACSDFDAAVQILDDKTSKEEPRIDDGKEF